MSKTLYIIDDHAMVKNGLKSWLDTYSDWKVIGIYATSQECYDALSSSEHPAIIICDVQLANETGFGIVKNITDQYSDIKCVMYSMYDTAGFVMQALDCGAKGYVSKASSEEELIKCLEAVYADQNYIEAKMQMAQSKIEPILSFLTKQEKRVFEEILKGLSNDEISKELNLSGHSVENYVSRLYDKLGIFSRIDILEKYR
ncbi:MAG: response regulator transcription factor [Treponema sp.]|nr:response regulator transcription factor [Spirochaetia bacterium]MDY5124494.1 response regulator transcription factor [Treponema sp.]